MQIDRIKISNFKSIQELDINFQEMHGLWEISGVVGAGKTTIGEAILFALFGSVRGKTNESLISWGKKHTLIESWVYCKNRHIYIRREINSYGQSPLIVTVEGEEILASDKRSIQTVLENEWFDISRQTLELLCVISFNNFKSLSTLNTQDSRDFLNSTVAFDRIDLYESYCKEQIHNHTENMVKYGKDKQYYTGALNALKETKPETPKYTNQDEIDKLVKEQDQRIADKNKELAAGRKVLEAEWKKEHDKSKTESVLLKQLKDSRKKLTGGICPLCGQPITPEHMSSMELEIAEHEAKLTEYDKVLEECSKKLVEYDNNKSDILKRMDYELLMLKQEQHKTSTYLKQLNTINDKEKKYKHNIKVFEEAIQENEGFVNQWKEMLDFIKDVVRPTIISSIIPNINKYITYYMGMAHQNYVVFFDESFKCMMQNPYGEPIPISSLSTGQKKIIDMIIILAFIKTFITQIDFNVYFMDELIGNIDADLRDIMCRLLGETLDEKDIMFLISHSPINQEYLDGVIRVTRTANISDYEIINISK